MTTLARTHTPETAQQPQPRTRTGGPRGTRNPHTDAPTDWFDRYTAQSSFGSHMPLDIHLHWDWRNPLNIIPAFVLLMFVLMAVGLIIG